MEYAAPLCYLFADQASCAVLFCSMYARFWCRLHTIDDTAGKHATLVSLCVLFVHLLEVCCQMDQSWDVCLLCIWSAIVPSQNNHFLQHGIGQHVHQEYRR